MRVRVKICGITRLEDAEPAVGLGADAIGLRPVAEKPAGDLARRRRANRQRAAAVRDARRRVRQCRRSTKFETAVDRVGLDAVQLHGDETPAAFRALPVRYLKVATLESDDDVRAVAAWPADVMPLVDAADRERRGGTGRVANWTRAAKSRSCGPSCSRADLTADNVAEAIASDAPVGRRRVVGRRDLARREERRADARFFAAVAADAGGGVTDVMRETPGPVFGRRDPDRRGYFGEFGGRFVPETLVAPVEALEAAYLEARVDPAFVARRSGSC